MKTKHNEQYGVTKNFLIVFIWFWLYMLHTMVAMCSCYIHFGSRFK